MSLSLFNHLVSIRVFIVSHAVYLLLKTLLRRSFTFLTIVVTSSTLSSIVVRFCTNFRILLLELRLLLSTALFFSTKKLRLLIVLLILLIRMIRLFIALLLGCRLFIISILTLMRRLIHLVLKHLRIIINNHRLHLIIVVIVLTQILLLLIITIRHCGMSNLRVHSVNLVLINKFRVSILGIERLSFY